MVASDPTKKKRKASGNPAYSSYIHKIFKQVHPNLTISGKAMEIVNGLIEDLEARVSQRSFSIARYQKKNTLSAKHVQAAVLMVFPPDVGNHAIGEGSKATLKFVNIPKQKAAEKAEAAKAEKAAN
mgnify:CR=1 FL=1